MQLKNFNELQIEFENWREHLISSDEVIEFTDYGAISPNHALSQEQMYDGVANSKTRKELCRQGFKNRKLERLFNLIREKRPEKIIELGTLCGLSSLYMAYASPASVIHTIEGAESVAEIASLTFNKFNVTGQVFQHIGRFQDILPDLLKHEGTIDCALIDGHHDGEATVRYYQLLREYLQEGGLIIFDDIRWSPGMLNAWMDIISDMNPDQILDYGDFGAVYI